MNVDMDILIGCTKKDHRDSQNVQIFQNTDYSINFDIEEVMIRLFSGCINISTNIFNFNSFTYFVNDFYFYFTSHMFLESF